MGLLYVVVPVKDAGDGDFAKSPRVKNLLFLGAPILAMFGVWEKAGITFDRTRAFANYVAGVGPTIVLLLILASTFIISTDAENGASIERRSQTCIFFGGFGCF